MQKKLVMKKNYYFLFLVSLVLISACKSESKSEVKNDDTVSKTEKPNIIIIYADDLGYGELGAYGATELKTPNLDKLANGGMLFTNGYASSATCTPSRYALLTGVYPWRNKKARILTGSAPLIIDTAQITIPKLLKKQGYATGIVGKWHLGLGNGNIDWNMKIDPGPNEVGFDYSYIMAATQDRVPTVYIQDGHVVNLDINDPIQVSYKENFEGEPTGVSNPELVKMKWHHGHNNSIVNGIPRIGYMTGGKSAKWKDIDMADTFLKEAQHYVKENKEKPFFLYYALQQPHVPRTPHPRFEGVSGMGPRGDVIVEADYCIGEFIKTLESEGLLENTLIVFSSDNGPVLNDGYYDNAVEKLGNHKPAGVLKGGKYSLFEAGTRVPFITYWKGKIKPGKSDAIVSQLDLLSSLAHLVHTAENTTDGKQLMSVFLGESQVGREDLVLEATSRTALRSGDWVMIPPYRGPKINKKVNIDLGSTEEYQLYNLKNDHSQESNLAEEQPEKLKEMMAKFLDIRGEDYQEINQMKLK